ncbi:MAG: histidine kinase [Candidatus Limnocylindrales bacterium]
MTASWPTAATWFARVVVPLVAIGFLIGIAVVQHGFADPAIAPTRNGDTWAVALHVSAGMVLIGGGIGALLLGVTIRAGLVGTLAGMAWFGPMLTGLVIDQPLVRALGAASAALMVPLLAHLVLSATSPGTLPRRSARVLAVLYALGSIASLVLFVTYAPFFDVRCVETCRSREAIAGLGSSAWMMARTIAGVVTLVSGVWIGVSSAWRVLRHRPAMPGGTMALLGGVVIGIAAIIGGLFVVARGRGLETSTAIRDDLEAAVSIGLSLGTLAVAVAVLRAVAHSFAARRRMRSIADGLATAPSPGSLGSALASALDDSNVRVAYWWTQERSYVDVLGRPVDGSPTSPGQVVTAIQRRGAPIAIVEHRADIDAEAFIRELRPSVLVALDNERLRATQLAQLRELRASRARICEVGDAERRRLERDLHDGAQQHLLAIAFELRVARLVADRGGDGDRASRLASAESLAMGIVDELRRLCRAIHPQVLSQTGLVPALAALAEEAPIPLEVHAQVPGRLPIAVETAAYELVVEALDQASHRGSAELTVEVDGLGDELVVEASDSRPEPLVAPVRLADRVGAAGGRLSVGASPRGAFMRAVLPCA